ncbi:hypothetical protein NDU88_001263 [Pleurodeles waltl]|uniref:Uncharacterized protein n=1 Tax=Pleurodeles waltl TaxID=8319 RepID=A0AAV7THU0_PLEWA|nr:hypothetical protein NDU88_001263 [Pleurodeles waltl]
MEKGQEARSAEEGEDTGAGNPGIRVPESIKREEGLRVRGAEEEKDAEGRDAGNAETGSSGEDEEKPDSELGKGGTLAYRGNTPEWQEGPKKPELRHVPGGAWLKQPAGCRMLFLAFR